MTSLDLRVGALSLLGNPGTSRTLRLIFTADGDPAPPGPVSVWIGGDERHPNDFTDATEHPAVVAGNEATVTVPIPAGRELLRVTIDSALATIGTVAPSLRGTPDQDQTVQVNLGAVEVHVTGLVPGTDVDPVEVVTDPAALAALSATFPQGETDEDDNAIVRGHAENSIGGGVSNTLVGGGQTGSPNAIVGAASLRTIVGGYDNTIGENIASAIIHGQHSTISGDATHAFIAGGSVLSITDGDYGAAVGGTNNVVSADLAAVVGGVTNAASGPRSAIIGGQNGEASGQGSAVVAGSNGTAAGSASATVAGTNPTTFGASSATVGGNGSTIGAASTTNGDYSATVGGFSNQVGTTTTARFSATVGGRALSIQEEYGAAIGGQDNTVADGASHALVSGRSALARLVGQQVQGGHQFAAQGDAQTSVVVVRAETTDATATLLTCNGAASSPFTRLTIPTDTTWAFSALIVARRTDTAGESAGYRVEGVAANNAGTVALVGTPTVTALAEDNAGWDVAVSVGSSASLAFTVTGEAAKTIRWVGRVTLAEVSG